MTSHETIDRTYVLDRIEIVPKLIADTTAPLFVSGLAGASRDLAALTQDAANTFTMAGAMGAGCMVGLGLALAQPDRRVIVLTGDGELLMNIGALATISILQPRNLAILCIDNGHYGETGYQCSHTSLGVDLEAIARGSGFHETATVSNENEVSQGFDLLNRVAGPTFVNLKVKPSDPPKFKRLLDPAACRYRFREALLGHY